MKRTVLPLLLFLVAAGALVASLTREDDFPHQAHEGLFPVCEGCHLGVVTGEADALFPSSESCAECHDGQREETVEWTPRGPRASNLRFFHPDHADLVEEEGDSTSCQSCHAVDVPESRMEVAEAEPEACLQCHAHEAPIHLAAGARCEVCHLPLTEAPELPTRRIAAFPWPPSHDEPGFLSGHAPETALEQVACATCHARNTCERCHVNADRLDEIRGLEPDARVASLEEGLEPVYPEPESHLDQAWLQEHGSDATDAPASCSTCHARESCSECHVETDDERTGRALAALPLRDPEGASGVNLAGKGRDVHTPDFLRRHESFAATGALECSECHREQYCSDCHQGSDSREFHPENFLERHAVEVFSGQGDCQSCHSTEAFCRDCHAASGIASEGRLNVAFHTAQPLWILAHGQAARTGLESCASCHRQTDCLACHSSVRGRGFNPHGPGFDAEGMAARNRVTCGWCHVGDPIGRE